MKELLFATTFYFGIMRMLNHTYIFKDIFVAMPFSTILAKEEHTRFFKTLDVFIFWGSLIYQIYFWFSKYQIIC